MRLTPPLLHDPATDPLALYDAYSISLLVSSANADFTVLRFGESTDERVKWHTGVYARRLSDVQRQGQQERKETAWRYVIRDLDLEIPLPEWESEEGLENGGFGSQQERSDVKEMLKGRGRVVAMSEWALKEANWIERDEQSSREGRERREKESREGKRVPPLMPEGGNRLLRTRFWEMILEMRKRVIGGVEHYSKLSL